MIRASVIVCTRNRAERLGRCLGALAAQIEPDGGTFEVLVVDNDSSDRTAEIAARFVADMPSRFRYLVEPRAGKSNALNRGIADARGELLMMTDDDCLPETDWAHNMVAEFDADPAVGVVGGRIELNDPRDHAVTVRTSRTRAELSDTAPLFFFVAGCNMAVRRQVAREVGEFDVGLGPGSRHGFGAEDVDFVYRAFRGGARVVYSPEPCVRHDHGRRTEVQLRALRQSYITGRGAFYAKHIIAGDRAALRMAYWELRGCAGRALGWPIRVAQWRAEWRVIVALVLGAGAYIVERVQRGRHHRV